MNEHTLEYIIWRSWESALPLGWRSNGGVCRYWGNLKSEPWLAGGEFLWFIRRWACRRRSTVVGPSSEPPGSPPPARLGRNSTPAPNSSRRRFWRCGIWCSRGWGGWRFHWSDWPRWGRWWWGGRRSWWPELFPAGCRLRCWGCCLFCLWFFSATCSPRLDPRSRGIAISGPRFSHHWRYLFLSWLDRFWCLINWEYCRSGEKYRRKLQYQIWWAN